MLNKHSKFHKDLIKMWPLYNCLSFLKVDGVTFVQFHLTQIQPWPKQ